MGDVKRIGYWGSSGDDPLPDPAAYVDPAWDEDERLAVASYLANGTIVAACMGFSTCRLCGTRNGTLEYTDGRFRWPEGLAHYVEDHNVRLPDEIVRHAVARMTALENAPVDDDWWRAEMAMRTSEPK